MNKRFNTISIAVVSLALLFSCGQKAHYSDSATASEDSYELSEIPMAEDEKIVTDADAMVFADNKSIVTKNEESSRQDSKSQPNFIATQAATTVNDDGIHKFIRTARLKFKVAELTEATYDIENVIIRNNGFIIRSAIKNDHSYSKNTNISEDSVLVTYYNNLTADMVLRVPQEKLDTVLRQIAPLATKIDYRVVEANDVTRQLLSDRLTKNRLAKKQQRMSNVVTNRSGKLNDAMSAEEAIDYAQQQADQTALSTYTMNDNIAYSTISIELYQDVVKYTEKKLREQEVEEYKPGFGSKALEALGNGWHVVSMLVILLINIWPLFAVLLIVFVCYLIYRKKTKNK